MAINFTLEESTRQDIVALASLRIRRDHRQAEDRHTPEWEAVEYLIRQEKLDQLLEFYLDLYECEPTDIWGERLTTPDEFRKEASGRMKKERIARPSAVTAAYFLFEKEINSVVAWAVATAVHDLIRYNRKAHEWDDDRASRQAQSAAA